jgi:hypothetical protein
LILIADGQQLTEIALGSPPPNPDDAGYYSVDAQPMPGWPDKVDPPTDGVNWFFLSVQATFPKRLRGARTMFTLTVRDASLDGAQSATDLNIGIPGTCLHSVKGHCPAPLYPANVSLVPSSAFLSGPDSKDDTAPPHMPRARLGILATEVTLAGWLDSANCCEANGPNNSGVGIGPGQSEDWHFGIFLDPDFIERNYGGAVPPFSTQQQLPGQPERQACWAANHFDPFIGSDDYSCPCVGLPGSTDCADKLPFIPDSLDVGSFLLSGNQGDSLEVELNAWHKSRNGGSSPTGWHDDPRKDFPDNSWPFDPKFGTVFPQTTGIATKSTELTPDDYVIVTGSLWQDIAHGDQGTAFDLNKCIDGILHAQGGWLEIHPVDVLRYVPVPPPLRKQTARVAACGTPNVSFFQSMSPPASAAPKTGPYGLKYQELPDKRFTSPSFVQQYLNTYVNPQDRHQLIASGSLTNVNNAAYYKAVEVMWWEKLGNPQLTVQMIVQPAGDRGVFNLLVDGATWAAGVGSGGSTGAQSTTVGSHTVSVGPGSGTKLSDYSITLDFDCGADGKISLALGDNKTCTVTAVSVAPCNKGVPGYKFCSGVCVNTANDPDNCGQCGKACNATFGCKAGKCVSSCPSGYSSCCGGDICVRSGTRCPVCP